jgi:hypothetical protein
MIQLKVEHTKSSGGQLSRRWRKLIWDTLNSYNEFRCHISASPEPTGCGASAWVSHRYYPAYALPHNLRILYQRTFSITKGRRQMPERQNTTEVPQRSQATIVAKCTLCAERRIVHTSHYCGGGLCGSSCRSLEWWTWSHIHLLKAHQRKLSPPTDLILKLKHN